MDNDKKERFFKKLVERTLTLDAQRKSEKKKQGELEDHILALEEMTNLDKSKIKELANEITNEIRLEDKKILINRNINRNVNRNTIRKTKLSPMGESMSKCLIVISLLIFVIVIIQILSPTVNEIKPEILAIQPDNIANDNTLSFTANELELEIIDIQPDNKFIFPETPPEAEEPELEAREYDVTEVKNKSPKIRLITTVATKTWGDDLNPTNEMPLNSFKAFYINTNNKKRIIATSYVKQAAVKYSYNELHNIHSGNFGAYWVGLFEFTEDQELQFNVYLGRSSARIIVDGFVVYEGGSKAKVPYLFTEGRHKIEVEFTNNWHTTDFKAVLEEIM